MLTKSGEYRRGWTVLLASALGSGTGVAPLEAYSLGAFIAPLQHQFGWTRAQITAAPFFKALAILLVGAAIGNLADRFGARKVALWSQALLAVSMAAMGLMTAGIWTLYAGYLCFSILGGGTLPMTWSRAVVGWFVRSRGLALGISLVGTGLIGAMLPSYIGWLVGSVGWRGAYVGLAALPLLLAMPVTLLFFREPPRSPATGLAAPRGAEAEQAAATGAVATGAAAAELPPADHRPHEYSFGEAIRTRCFWQISISFMLVAVAVTAVLVHALPLLLDRGVEPHTAAAMAGIIGLAVTSGRLVSGYLLDSFSAPAVACVMFVLPAGACGLLSMTGTHLWGSAIAIALIGLAGGAEHDIAAYLSAKYFGRLHYGAVYGLLYTIYSFGAGIGPWVVGKVHDSTHSYDAALKGGIVLFLLSAILVATIRPPRPPASLRTSLANHAAI